MSHSGTPRVFIIEGIAGSGKDTLSRVLHHSLNPSTRPVYYYPEEAVACSYTHVFWPGIVPVRFSLLEAALDFVEAESARLPGVSFIFNRFHLTLGITMARKGKASDFHSRYERLINRLKQLNILVLLLQLKEHEIAAKLHLERAQEELVWKLFLERRLTETPYDTVQELFTAQQELLNRLIKEQGLPYQTGTLEELLGFVTSF